MLFIGFELGLGVFYAPRHKMAGAYSVNPFRHSVLPSFRSFRPSVIPSFRPSGFSFRSLSKSHMEIFKWNLVHYKVCHENTQVEFEVGSGRKIFGRVMPLGLRKIPLIFSFRSLSPLQIDILNWNSVYRFVRRIHRLSSKLGPVLYSSFSP